MRRTARRVAAALCVAVLAAPMAACTEPLPTSMQQTSPGTSPVVTDTRPAVTGEQEATIRATILSVVNGATALRDSSGLSARVTGPELDARISEIAVLNATGSERSVTELPAEASQVNLPIAQGWPRDIFTFTTTTSDQQSQRLLVMRQESPRSNYKLWGVCPLFQDVEMPAFSVDGSQLGSPDDEGLVMTPREALDRYTDVLTNRDASQWASQFESDQLRNNIISVAAQIQGTFDTNGVPFTQSETFTADSANVQVMRTADGGELVVGRIDSTWVRSFDENRQALPASDAEKALFGDTQATSSIQVTYVNTVALYVPAADSGQLVRAVGAERQPVRVEAGASQEAEQQPEQPADQEQTDQDQEQTETE